MTLGPPYWNLDPAPINGSEIGDYTFFIRYQTINSYVCKGCQLKKDDKYIDNKPSQVIIKFSKITLATTDMIQKELNFLESVQHTNIISLIDKFRYNNYFCFVFSPFGFKLFENQNGQFTEKEAANLFHQMLSAVYYLHESGNYHGDISPDSFYICYEKLGEKDNALVQLVNFESLNSTNPVGTLGYQSPEIINNQSVNEKTDIWGLGCLLYQMLSNQIAFDPASPAYAANVTNGNFNFPLLAILNISQDAQNMVANMLNTDPINRPSTKDLLDHQWFQQNPPKKHVKKTFVTPVNRFSSIEGP